MELGFSHRDWRNSYRRMTSGSIWKSGSPPPATGKGQVETFGSGDPLGFCQLICVASLALGPGALLNICSIFLYIMLWVNHGAK